MIEILVVLAIAAIISSVTLGGFNEMRAGNKRVSCSTNLTQLYQAARLYAADEGGKFPHYKNPCTTVPFADTQEGIGLWALYTFPKDNSATGFNAIAPVGMKPVERYLRSSKVLHCPADIGEDAAGHSNGNLYTDANRTDFNPAYLSYQTCDDGDETPGVPGVATYATQRVVDTADPNWKRQLLHLDGTNFVQRQPTGNTIVTYCLYHRGERNMDNVLFYDGSVQLVQKETDPANNWKRIPKDPQ